jgi:hypothetical protein
MSVSNSTASGDAIDCDSVVEALVREHLTKKQYNSTLAAFQQEQVGANCVLYGFGWLKRFPKLPALKLCSPASRLVTQQLQTCNLGSLLCCCSHLCSTQSTNAVFYRTC